MPSFSAIMSIADNVDVKKADGTETRMSVFYTVKAWEKKAEQIAEEETEVKEKIN